MKLRRLTLTNFKNIAHAELDFSSKINCLLGDNGMGKSNLLDGIYYLSFAKSFSRLADSMLIRQGEDFGIIEGFYERHGADEHLLAGLRKGIRRTFKRAGKEYKRLSQHIGLFPAVMVSPADSALVTEGAEERRRFLDMLISQADAPYLEALIRYNNALEQRNKLLKQENTDIYLFDTLEEIMSSSAAYISSRRGQYTEILSEVFGKYYSLIAGEGEKAEISYVSSTSEYDTLKEALEKTRQRDQILHYTTKGPHRDELLLTLSGMPARQTASQGQTKTFTIALRLAQYEFLRQATGIAPLLLLDDIFDKLDSHRVERIMQIVASEDFGQIFITDTNRKHLDEILKRSGPDFKMWSVKEGAFEPVQ